ncbi:hypothetical protein RJ55_08470 [Drechmeria coniospora]|nr:hypothetical protein RJ55_08470 [Drechmeria coniospora]
MRCQKPPSLEAESTSPWSTGRPPSVFIFPCLVERPFWADPALPTFQHPAIAERRAGIQTRATLSDRRDGTEPNLPSLEQVGHAAARRRRRCCCRVPRPLLALSSPSTVLTANTVLYTGINVPGINVIVRSAPQKARIARSRFASPDPPGKFHSPSFFEDQNSRLACRKVGSHCQLLPPIATRPTTDERRRRDRDGDASEAAPSAAAFRRSVRRGVDPLGRATAAPAASDRRSPASTDRRPPPSLTTTTTTAPKPDSGAPEGPLPRLASRAMSGADVAAAQGGGNNASEFVSRRRCEAPLPQAAAKNRPFRRFASSFGTCPRRPAGWINASMDRRRMDGMLEDPSHQDVARWGKDGDTFVVVEVSKRAAAAPGSPPTGS